MSEKNQHSDLTHSLLEEQGHKVLASTQPAPLSDLSAHAADIAAIQQERLAYWKRQLVQMPPTLPLPFDHPYMSGQIPQRAVQPVACSQNLTDSLRVLSQQEGITLEAALLAAFGMLLYRYSGQDDLIVGLIPASRTAPNAQDLPTSTGNPLPLRIAPGDTLPFHELLRAVQQSILEVQTHEVTFASLLQAVQPERREGQHPIFQALLHCLPPASEGETDQTVQEADASAEADLLDLSLTLEMRADGLRGHFAYRADLFDATTISRLAANWQVLLQSIVSAPQQALAELPMLAEEERQYVLTAWNESERVYPVEGCLHTLFEIQATRTPEAVALLFGQERLTYHELNERANQLARHLRKLGVGPEVMVGMYVERSLETVVGILGILKAGGAYVPMDTAYPKERLAFMCEDARLPVLLTQQRLRERLPEHTAAIVCLDSDWATIAQESAQNLDSAVNVDHPAYVIYTSGSTGKPKGVVVLHRNVVRLFAATQEWYTFDARDVWTLFHSYAFDFSVWELWGALLYGGELVIVPYEVSRSPDAFYELLHRERVTVLNQTPSAFQQLIRAEESRKEPLQLALRLVIFGGEALEMQSLKPWFERHGDASPRLVNMYGITETTVHVTYRPLSWAEVQGARSVIGRPIPDLQLYLLNQRQQPVPIGVPGELYVGGAGLAREYLNRPDLTEQRFLPDPFSQRADARLYKTGDLARCLPDGEIEYLGRIDHQVKIRGFRIEIGEIEAALMQQPGVQAVVVMAREDIPGDKRLVAYIVADSERMPTTALLRKALQARLPDYMVPSAFLFLEAFPLTTNGKVDRRALPVPDQTRRMPEATFVAPTLPIQHQLVQIWEELLHVQPIGIRDDFFALGGHSLLAARMLSLIEQQWGRKLPFSALFASATIEALAELLMQQGADSTAGAAGTIATSGTETLPTVVAVQASGTQRPFFYLHGEWVGGGLYCRKIADHLGPDQPFYVLEPYQFADRLIPPGIEEMAAAHIQAMRSIQPTGPYLLGGYCNGGLIAYEMARQLEAQRQQVHLLVLVNPEPPIHRSRLYNLLRASGTSGQMTPEQQVSLFLLQRYLAERWHRRMKKFRDLGQPTHIETTEEQIEHERRRSRKRSLLERLGAALPTAATLHSFWPAMYEWSALGYTPSPYHGTVTIFCVEKERAHSQQWRTQVETGQIEVHTIPGTHTTCRTQHIAGLAAQLRTCLQAVQESIMPEGGKAS
jgi:amino acid adenylation domain-containing protein